MYTRKCLVFRGGSTSAEDNTTPSKLAFRKGIADRDVDTQQLAWLTQTTLILANLDVRPGVIDGGWDLIVQRRSFHQLMLRELVGLSAVLDVATTQWHVLLLEVNRPAGDMPCVTIINRITGLRVCFI